MEIRLGYIEQYDTGYSTYLDKQITEQEYDKYISNIDELNNYENLKRLFEILILNHNEFIEFTMVKSKVLFDNSLSISGDKESYNQHYLNLNRILLNYLSSFRTLLDHVETIIKRKYGKASNQTSQFQEQTSYLFDNYFAYRFMYKLRNYAQHCGLPIDEFSISATKISDNKFKTEYKVDFDSVTLLSKFKEWGKVKNDLINIKTISIFPILDEMKLTIDLLWNRVVLIFEHDIENAIKFLVDNAGNLKTEHCEVCLFTDIVTDENNRLKYFTNQTIPFDTIDEFNKNKNCT